MPARSQLEKRAGSRARGLRDVVDDGGGSSSSSSSDRTDVSELMGSWYGGGGVTEPGRELSALGLLAWPTNAAAQL